MARRWRCSSAPRSWMPAAWPAFRHASVCGGRGRCSTCRVRISAGAQHLPPASDAERKVLDRVGAAPNVRLACQARPHRRRRHRAAAAAQRQPAATPRRGPAICRAMRRRSPSCSPICAPSPAWPSTSCPMTWCSCSTAISAPWALAVENTGGRLDKFIGDGVMALFGIGADPGEGCRQALAAAAAMARESDRK